MTDFLLVQTSLKETVSTNKYKYTSINKKKYSVFHPLISNSSFLRFSFIICRILISEFFKSVSRSDVIFFTIDDLITSFL